MTDTTDKHVKGGVFLARERIIRERYGEMGLKKMYSNMHSHGQNWVDGISRMKPAEKYPIELYLQFLEGIKETFGVVRGYDIFVSPLMCESLTYYFLGIVESTSAKNPRIEHTKCVARGDDHCEWEVWWED